MFKPKLPKQEQGFTLIEVLVAILIATIFITIAMQMMVAAAVFKVKAQENAEATNWIQEDLENVKYQAGQLQFPFRTSLTTDATAGSNSISVGSAANLVVNDTLKIGLDPSNYRITAISGTTLNIAPQLATNQVTNAGIVETTMCNPASRNVGLADALRDIVTGSNQTGNSNSVDNPPSSGNTQTSGTPLTSKLFTNKKYTLQRTTTTSADAPYNVLKIQYKVSSGATFDDSKKIAQFDTEVIPNVAFQCP